jgi:hypothetical protein
LNEYNVAADKSSLYEILVLLRDFTDEESSFIYDYLHDLEKRKILYTSKTSDQFKKKRKLKNILDFIKKELGVYQPDFVYVFED